MGILFAFVSVYVIGKEPNTHDWSSMADNTIIRDGGGDIWSRVSPIYICCPQSTLVQV